jgi:hypothetical protein
MCLFLTFGATSAVFANEVRIKQQSVSSSAFVRQAQPQAFAVRQTRAVAPAPRQAPAPQITAPTRINDFSQVGRTDRFSIPSVRDGVRITQTP